MSDLQSVPPAPERTVAAGRKLVNTNAVLQRTLQRLSAEERSTIALRCDELPVLEGNEEDFESVFSGLLQLILQEKKNLATLFLHIHCTSEEIDPKAQQGLKQISIQFNTNVTPCADWLEQNDQQFNEVAGILQTYGGNLLLNQLKNSGCTFSVSLPGKLSNIWR